MNRKQILAKVKELDECGMFPYLYDALTDGSTYAEKWLMQLEDKELKTETDLIAELETMFATR